VYCKGLECNIELHVQSDIYLGEQMKGIYIYICVCVCVCVCVVCVCARARARAFMCHVRLFDGAASTLCVTLCPLKLEDIYE